MAEVQTPAWPVKTRDMLYPVMDSRNWDGFQFRGDDIVIATYAKTGTTWTQQIVGQMLCGGADDFDVHGESPWLDMRVPPLPEKLAQLAAQTHRRFIKTHLPVDALVFSPKAKYVYIARDGRDVAWSLHNHFDNFTDFALDMFNNQLPPTGHPPWVRPGPDLRAFFLEWMERDGWPAWPFFQHVKSWWDVRHLPNVKLFHFNDLKSDLDGQMRAMAAFLDISIDEDRWPRIVEKCTFDWMKENAPRILPMADMVWEGGGRTFINKGTNQRWKDVLTPADNAAYEDRARFELGEECAAWLAAGEWRNAGGVR